VTVMLPHWVLLSPRRPLQSAPGQLPLLCSYSVITSHCGAVYNNCSWCDNEAQYQCPAYVAAGGFCGFHYVTPGWEALGNSTATVIRTALAQRGQLREGV
jgi:hypothetical protein